MADAGRKLDAGIDIVSDGEQYVGFSMYVPQRMTGFGSGSVGRRRSTTTSFRCSRRCISARRAPQHIGNPPNAIGPVRTYRAARGNANVPRRAR